MISLVAMAAGQEKRSGFFGAAATLYEGRLRENDSELCVCAKLIMGHNRSVVNLKFVQEIKVWSTAPFLSYMDPARVQGLDVSSYEK
jgi:hypothetical protein